jgi:hypothetical protein
LPRVVDLARETLITVGRAWEAVMPLLLSLATVPVRLAASLFELLAGLGSLLRWLGPVAKSLALFCCLIMIATITTVVARDLTRRKPVLLNKEPS